MKSSRRLAAVVFFLLIICSSMLSCGSPEETENSEDERKRQTAGGREADEEAEFAAAVLDLVYDRVRDVGNVFRIVGDTAGGLAGGGIKAVGAGVHGVSSVLDAVSRTVEPKPGVLVEETSPPSASSEDLSEAADRAETRDSKTHTAHDWGQDASHSSRSSSNSPDPFDRISSMARSSLAGSLKLVSAATRGVGDAVFQAGTVAEELTGGTGQVAEDVVRVVQGAVGRARDDALKSGNRNDDAEEGQTESQSGKWPSSPSEPQAAASSESTSAGGEDTETTSATAPGVMRVVVMVWKLCREMGAFAVMMLEEALREVVGLFRSKNGALPAAPRLAVLIILVLLICRGRRRHLRNGSSQQQQQQEQLYLQSAEMAPPTTPQRSDAAVGQEPSPGLASSSRSLFPHTPMSSTHPPPPEVVGQLPSFGAYDGTPDGLDPLLPSPAQALARAPYTRARRMRTAGRGRLATGLVDEEIDVEGAAATMSGRVASEEEATSGRRDWRWVFRWTGLRRSRGEGIVRWRCILLVLLWFSASVLEEIERDRVAWLAWDKGFRAGEASRVGDPDAAAESVAWLNSLIDGMWGGQRSGLYPRKSGVGVARGTVASPGVLDGLRSFVSEYLGTSITETLDELNSKPGRAVRMELQEVDLGASSPQILGVKVLDPASPAVPGWGDGRCGTLEKDCLAFRIDLEVATRGLRVGVGVKPSARGEKALLPTGKVRLLELYFKGSLSVRVERRDEFPFVGMALVAFDGVPDVQVRMEKWGLDTLTLGRLDKWARLGVQVALKPFVFPLYLEVDAALALCSDCPASTPTNASLRQEALGGAVGSAPNTLSIRPPSRPSVAAAAAAPPAAAASAAPAAAASAAAASAAAAPAMAASAMAASAVPDKVLVSRARSRRTSSSDKLLVRDTTADELQQQVRIASDWDPKGSGGSLGRDSSSGEDDRREDITDERQAPVSHTSSSMASKTSAAEVDPKIHKWRSGIGRVLRRFKDPKRTGGSLGRDSSSGKNDRMDDRTDERQAPVSHTSSSMVSEASAAEVDPKNHKWRWGIGRVLRRFKDPKRSGGSLDRDSSSGENDRMEDRTGERQAPVSHTSFSMGSEASTAAADPKLHKRGWGIGRVLRRFLDWLMSGLDAEMDRAWRLSPMDLDGFE